MKRNSGKIKQKSDHESLRVCHMKELSFIMEVVESRKGVEGTRK